MSKRSGISILPKGELETLRRIGCDEVAIRDFFTKHKNLLDRDPKLIFNMDETMVSAKKKLKVLCPQDLSALTESTPKCPHITACVTIGADGDVLKPMFILPNNKKNIKELGQFSGRAYFASSESGWINKYLFMYWGLLFLAEISKYRLSLPDDLRNKRILLILDGHRSRANYFLANLFDSYGIDILILPGHTSHLLQPFDVSIASPLKSKYQERVAAYDLKSAAESPTGRKKSLGELRIMMVRCFLDALSQSATLTNIQSGFKASGIFPLNPEVPLASKYAMDSSLRERFPEIYQDINNDHMVNNHHLNGNLENLKFTFKADHGFDPNNDDLKIYHEFSRCIINRMKRGELVSATILSPIPIIYDEKNGNIFKTLNDGHLRQ